MAEPTERDYAIALANRIVDKPYIDHDGDIVMLARQFLRETERADSAREEGRHMAIEECAKIADDCKSRGWTILAAAIAAKMRNVE